MRPPIWVYRPGREPPRAPPVIVPADGHWPLSYPARMKRSAAGLLFVLVFAAAPAFAQPTSDEVAAQVAETGFFIDEGLPASPSSISASVSRARNAGIKLFVVLLDADPPGGATTFADAVFDRTGGNGTVLVLSDSGEGIASSEFDQRTLENALDHALGSSSDDEGYVSALVDHLIDPSVATPERGGGGRVLLIVLIALVALIVWGIRRAGRTAKRRDEQLLDEARGELQAQIGSVANKLLDISDIVSASDTKKDDTYLRQAAATFTEVESAYAQVADLHDLEELSDRLDVARWELEAAEAIAFGREVPPKPEPQQRYVCFFDPTHGDASETAQIRTATGKRTVRVCKADAALLRRGKQPEPRMVTVDGLQVPSPAAPKSHGGSGFDGLDLFTILTRGAAAASYDWGVRRRGSPSTWSSGASRTSGSGSRSSTARRSSTRSSPGSSSRAGRTRRRGR
jgi:hypothetical protein